MWVDPLFALGFFGRRLDDLPDAARRIGQVAVI
jgi:hypothetical protein